MNFIILKYTLYSLLIIVCFHYIYDFLKNTLTIPKTIDLVNKPINIYDNIYKTLNTSKTNIVNDENIINKEMNNINNINNISSIDNINNDDNFNSIMKKELKNFFENLKPNDYNDDFTNKLNYSDYTTLQ